MTDNNPVVFISSTVMGKQQNKKTSQLLQSLFDSSDSFQFRTPVDWKAFNLLDYPTIIKKPMDLGTVRKNLNNNSYQTVQDCLRDIQIIWQNCKVYNKDNQYFQRLADKLDKMTKKMIKNYLPFVFFEIPGQKKKGPGAPSKKDSKKPTTKIPQQPKTYEDRKQNQIQQQAKQEDSLFLKLRKQFLYFIPLCTPQQIGVMFLLINKNEKQAIEYTKQGDTRINAQKLSDQMVKRLIDQMDMWGIGYVSTKKK